MPTIKKISLNGVSYDLGDGLTEDVKQASLQIAEKVAYIDEHGQDYYDELYTAFYDNMWNVTNTLSNAVTSNPAVKTLKDGTYTAIISAATGYTLEGATVSVTMNGANITSSVYNNGTISIPSVTGDVVITVVAVALTVVSISAVYTQSGTVYDTDSLDSLKANLVVTATFNDSSTSIVPSADYTLSGTLTDGTSTVTVSYSGKTTAFSVTVTAVIYSLFNRTFNGTLDGQETTNVKLLETDRNFTLTLDVDFAGSQPSSQVWVVFRASNGVAPYEGIGLVRRGTGSSQNYGWILTMTGTVDINQLTTSFVGNVRLVFRHSIGNTWEYWYKINDGSIVSGTKTSTFVSVTNALYFGRYFNGTINEAIFYPEALSSDKVNAYMSS